MGDDSTKVTYRRDGDIGWIDLDDGKANVMSPDMQRAIHDALDRADADGVVTVVRGRPGMFSAGFDLGILGGDDPRAGIDMVLGGFRLAHRMLAHERPVVMVCTGHAVAMGVFLLLSGDHRIGVDGDAKIVANEVAIGMTMPYTAELMLRQRLTPAAHQRATLLAEPFDPRSAVPAGFLDEAVRADELDGRVSEVAERLARLDVRAQTQTKRRTRAELLDAVSAAIERDRADLERRVGM